MAKMSHGLRREKGLGKKEIMGKKMRKE